MQMLTRIAMWGLLFCVPVAAHAGPQQGENPEVGLGLICNSAAQVERFLALHIQDQSPEVAIKAVNNEMHDDNACSMAAIAFVRGKEGNSVPAPGGQMKVMEIRIVAAQTPAGWQRVDHLVQYTAIFEKLDEA